MRVRERVESFAQDLRYAARGLARRPAFTAVAVVTLAIGIGATTSIFSAVNVLLLRDLPFAHPDELMNVAMLAPRAGPGEARRDMVWSYPKFTVVRDAQNVFSELSLHAPLRLSVTSGEVELVDGEAVGATYFRTLGATPVRGRDFARGDDTPGSASRDVIISSSFWQRRFNADPAIVGRTIELDRHPFTIIGVAPAGFRGLSGRGDLFVPIAALRPAEDLAEAESYEFSLVARRRAGVTTAQAANEVQRLGTRVNEMFPDRDAGGAAWGAVARPLDDGRVAPLIRRSLLILFGAVGFVLLIACVNVANLLLGRANARRREIAVRIAIGAGRARLVRLLITESVVLASLGAAASVAVAWIGIHALNALNPLASTQMQRLGGLGAVTLSPMHLDWSAFGFTLAVALVVGLVFGLAPALHATRMSLAGAMKGVGDGAQGRASRGRRLLVVTEVALAVVLLAGSGLLLRSLGNLLAIEPGFDAQNVLTLRLTIPRGDLALDSIPAFHAEMLDRLRAVPGVAEASIASCAPLSAGCNTTRIDLKDRPPVDIGAMPSVGVRWTSPTWFRTMGVPIRRGRAFAAADRAGAPKVVLVSETAARTFWPHGDAIGKRVGVLQGGFGDGAEVVGIVGDVRQWADSLPAPDVYLPYAQSSRAPMIIFLRTRTAPLALMPDVRRALRALAPRYPIYDIRTMDARVAAATAQPRFSATLLGLFAATALSLAAVGVYGVMSLVVAGQTREIGIRMALGADQGQVRRRVVREGLVLVAGGAVLGLAGALACTRLLRSLLFDLEPTDPVTYIGIVVVLGAAAFAASWMPARRAANVDPVVALRAE